MIVSEAGFGGYIENNVEYFGLQVPNLGKLELRGTITLGNAAFGVLGLNAPAFLYQDPKLDPMDPIVKLAKLAPNMGNHNVRITAGSKLRFGSHTDFKAFYTSENSHVGDVQYSNIYHHSFNTKLHVGLNLAWTNDSDKEKAIYFGFRTIKNYGKEEIGENKEPWTMAIRATSETALEANPSPTDFKVIYVCKAWFCNQIEGTPWIGNILYLRVNGNYKDDPYINYSRLEYSLFEKGYIEISAVDYSTHEGFLRTSHSYNLVKDQNYGGTIYPILEKPVKGKVPLPSNRDLPMLPEPTAPAAQPCHTVVINHCDTIIIN